MNWGVALGSGGAKGFAHLGVLRRFREQGIQFDCVAGTSIGSVVGAAYAADCLEELTEYALNLSITDIPRLLSPTLSVQGFFDGRHALEQLLALIKTENIEDLPKPYAAVATNIHTEEPVIFSKGDLRSALRASIAIPLLFTPTVVAEQLLVDGGIVEPLPVAATRELGAKRVVAVDLFGPFSSQASTEISSASTSGLERAFAAFKSLGGKLRGAPDSQTPWASVSFLEMSERTLNAFMRRLTSLRLSETPADLLIQPPLANIGILDFHKAEIGIEAGYVAADEAIKNQPNLFAS